VPHWTARPGPGAPTLTGSFCRLERLDADRHAAELFSADRLDISGASWTYLPYGPFADLESYRRWVHEAAVTEDPRFYAVIDTDDRSIEQTGGRAAGVLSLLRVQPEAGSIEVGHIHYSPLLQRRRGATEAQFLLMRYAFDDLGYRRYEWNATPSTLLPARRPSAWGSVMRAPSAKPTSSRAATVTPPGSRSSTTNGRTSRPPAARGSPPRTSTIAAASGHHYARALEPPLVLFKLVS
jgi:RimJ/RimL family protein N-acetyltransferase